MNDKPGEHADLQDENLDAEAVGTESERRWQPIEWLPLFAALSNAIVAHGGAQKHARRQTTELREPASASLDSRRPHCAPVARGHGP
jgi:hypothetical protein